MIPWGAVVRGRASIRGILTDRCTILRPTGREMDPINGWVSTAWESYIETPCRLRTRGAGEGVAGAETVHYRTLEVQIPADWLPPLRGHKVVFTECADPSLIGVPLWVTDCQIGTHLVMRRVAVSLTEVVDR